MKYFIDTEFIEGFNRPLFGKKRHFIDLISIGIVAEDGRTYEAISSEYKYHDADEWVQKNVIIPLYISTVYGDQRNRCDADNFQWQYGKPNAQISKEIIHFTNPELFLHNTAEPDLEFYGYYCGFDMVLLASMFGNMDQLPKGFPMYWNDLKQTLDEKYKKDFRWHAVFEAQNKNITNEQKFEKWKNVTGYPQQGYQHNALADALWNFELYKFLQTI